MGGTKNLGLSVISRQEERKRKGTAANYYINAKHQYGGNTPLFQVTSEQEGTQHLLAVCENMEGWMPEGQYRVSLVAELEKYQDRILRQGKSFDGRLDLAVQCVQETSNLLYSLTLNKPEARSEKPSFAGLVLSEDQGVVLSIGSSRAFLYRQGELNCLTKGREKAERLLKLGIINQQQADSLSSQLEVAGEESRGEVRRTDIFDVQPGDIFLLCTGLVQELLEDETVQKMLRSGKEPGEMATSILEHMESKGDDRKFTLMVVVVPGYPNGRVPTILEELAAAAELPEAMMEGPEEEVRPKRSFWLAALLAVVILAGAVFAGNKILGALAEGKLRDTTSQATTQEWTIIEETQSPSEDTSEPGTTEQEQTSGPSDGQESETPAGENGGSGQTYTVQQGDNLGKISMKFYGTQNNVELIMKANNMTDPNRLSEGQVLTIPEDPASGQ